MADHQPVTHENCENWTCPICEGGLFLCRVCGLTEGCLTSECPGEFCYLERGDDVYEGRIDFKGGEWVAETSPSSPAYYRVKSEWK